MQTYRICVTQEDIDQGARQSCVACPIALAARRAGVANAEVGCRDLWQTTWDEDGEDETTFVRMPQVARDFVRAFDRNEKTSPFEFEVTL